MNSLLSLCNETMDVGCSMMNLTVTTRTRLVYDKGTLSAEAYEFYSAIFTWVKVIGLPISLVCLLLSAAIFMRKRMRSPSTIFLVAWNLTEAVNVVMLTIYQVCYLDKTCSGSWFYGHLRLWTTTYLAMACRRCVYVFNCLVAVQRFIVVAFPVKSRDIRVLQRPLPVCLVVLLISLATHAYFPIRYTVNYINGVYVTMETDYAIANKTIFNALSSTTMYVLVYFPLLVGSLANLGMAVALKRHVKAMKHVPSNQDDKRKKEMQTNRVVLVSTFLFFLFSVPSNLNQLVAFYSDQYGSTKKEHFLYLTLSGAFVTGQVVSDISIFLSFMCASSSFRCHLVHIVTFRTLVRYIMKACAVKSKEVVLDPHTASSRISTIFEPE